MKTKLPGRFSVLSPNGRIIDEHTEPSPVFTLQKIGVNMGRDALTTDVSSATSFIHSAIISYAAAKELLQMM